jgi:hypothetical protein
MSSMSTSDLEDSDDFDSNSDYLPSDDEDYLPSDDEEIQYDSEIDLFKKSPINGMKVTSEAPFRITTFLPYV